MDDSLWLREVMDADLPVFFAHQLDPTANHMAAFTTRDPADRAAFDAHWQRLRADPQILMRTIVCQDQVAGHVSSYVHDGSTEVTYWLGREYWGRGLATQALAQFLRLQPTRPLWARAARDNLASLRVLEKCGFLRVGQERGYANARGEEIDEIILKLDAGPP